MTQSRHSDDAGPAEPQRSRPPVRPRRRRRSHPGTAPGAFVVDPDAHPTTVRALRYGAAAAEPVASPERIEPVPDGSTVWIRVQGLADAERLRRLAEALGVHALALEDVVHTHQRAKVELYGDKLFVVVRAPDPAPERLDQQIALVLGPGFVVSFEERATPLFDPVAHRIQEGLGKVRRSGADYLLYALIDTVVDSWFPELEREADELEALEHEVLAGGSGARDAPQQHIWAIRRRLLVIRRHLWPHRDVASRLTRGEFDQITDGTLVFFRDCSDHVAQAVDQLDHLRDLGSGLMELHLALAGQRMGEVMKVLTVIATIFIPLTFVAGVYGMNFATDVSPWNMPELRWRYGYPAVLGLMAAIAVGLLWFFRRKGWLGARRDRRRRA